MKMSEASPESTPSCQLKWYERLLLTLLAALLRAWGRTLRFHWGAEVQAVMDGQPAPSVVIFWHNRLFSAPVFYLRYFRGRRLATLSSVSKDGTWVAEFVAKLGMHPIQGSRSRRGAQAVRELIKAQSAGLDIALTPDGSRGPMYDMKGGAVTVAMKTGAPILLLSFNHTRAWRLKSWDRFYIPVPFSRVEVRMDAVGQGAELSEDPRVVAQMLKSRMDVITRD